MKYKLNTITIDTINNGEVIGFELFDTLEEAQTRMAEIAALLPDADPFIRIGNPDIEELPEE